MPLAALSLHAADFAHAFQLAFESRDPFLHPAAIDLQLCFARPSRPNSAGLSRKVVPHSRYSRQKILQLRQFDLQPALPTPRALRENIENELGAVEDLARKQIFQITSLCWGKFVVKNYRGDSLAL